MDHRRRTFMTFSALALAGLSAQWAALEPDRRTAYASEHVLRPGGRGAVVFPAKSAC